MSQRTKPTAFSMTDEDRVLIQACCVMRGTSNKSMVMREALRYYAKRLRQELESEGGNTG